jgi:hypothetical protein
MARDYHVYEWDNEPADERPSEFMRSTGYGGLFPTTQHGDTFNSQYGTFASTQSASLGDSGFTRPSPLPRERVPVPRRRFRDLPISVVLVTIFGGVAFLLYEFIRLNQR